MAAELVQVRMTKSVDFASRGELVWLEPELAVELVRMSLCVKIRERAKEVEADGGEGDRDAEPAAGDGARRKGKREAGPQAG